jgi:hypothetical protein
MPANAESSAAKKISVRRISNVTAHRLRIVQSVSSLRATIIAANANSVVPRVARVVRQQNVASAHGTRHVHHALKAVEISASAHLALELATHVHLFANSQTRAVKLHLVNRLVTVAPASAPASRQSVSIAKALPKAAHLAEIVHHARADSAQTLADPAPAVVVVHAATIGDRAAAVEVRVPAAVVLAVEAPADADQVVLAAAHVPAEPAGVVKDHVPDFVAISFSDTLIRGTYHVYVEDLRTCAGARKGSARLRARQSHQAG